MFSRFRYVFKTAVVVAVSSAAGFVVSPQVKTVFASWTTNYEPSVQWDWDWDKREPSSIIKPKKKRKNGRTDQDLNNNLDNSNENQTDEDKIEKHRSKATRYLILVRHGQYTLDGVSDKERVLTDLGKEQARLTGQRLKALDLPITRLVYSTMTRATETANIMMQYLGKIDTVETSDLLREGAPIPPEPPAGHWRPENHQFFGDGPRIEAAFRRFFHRAPPSQTEDSYEVLVCHANVIRYVVCRALQFPPEAWLRISLHNGSMTVLAIRPSGTVSIRQLGECGHMPPGSLSLT